MILNRISLFWTRPGLIWVVLVGELSVREVFCVLGRIWGPACGSRLGVRSCWEMYVAEKNSNFGIEDCLALNCTLK